MDEIWHLKNNWDELEDCKVDTWFFSGKFWYLEVKNRYNLTLEKVDKWFILDCKNTWRYTKI